MTKPINVLILSCGSRNKIIRYFKDELAGRGRVVAADCSPLAPALYDADHHVIVPRMDDEGYLEAILAVCRDHEIRAVFTLIDPEISFLAQNRDRFLGIGTLPIVSDLGIVEHSFDKLSFSRYLTERGFHTIRTFGDKEEFYAALEQGKIDFPVFAKPIRGSGSAGASKISSREELEMMYRSRDDLIIQEFMDGDQYDADIYADLISGELVAIFLKQKLRMRAGEADKTVSVKDEALFALLGDFVRQAGFRGVLDIDLFHVNGRYYILEVNPRFGGNYPHAHEAGVNMARMIINNLDGRINESRIGDYEAGTFMMKYNELKFMSPGELSVPVDPAFGNMLC